MRRHDDRGQLAGGEAIPFGLLIFVTGALLIANAWAVVDAKFAVDAATDEAVRSLTEAEPDLSFEEAYDNAVVRGRRALRAHGRRGSKLTFGEPNLARSNKALTRCTEVTLTGHYTVPAITLPFIGGFGDGIEVSATHTRLVDPLRSGLSGEATCL